MNLLKLFIFRKKTDTHDAPILDACEFLNINKDELKTVLDKYGQFLEQGVASQALEIHKSNQFPQVVTTAEALNIGQNCFADFCKKFYSEYYSQKGKAKEMVDLYEKELDTGIDK